MAGSGQGKMEHDRGYEINKSLLWIHSIEIAGSGQGKMEHDRGYEINICHISPLDPFHCDAECVSGTHMQTLWLRRDWQNP